MKNYSRKNKKYIKYHYSRAFTLMEVLVIIFLMSLITIVSLQVLTEILNRQRVEKDAESAYSYLQRARNQTLTGEGGYQYGVSFSTTTITLFRGTSYVAGDPNVVTFTLLNDSVFQNVNLTGSTTQLYFQKISGKPSAVGTIEVVSRNKTSIREIITIYASGLTEIQ